MSARYTWGGPPCPPGFEDGVRIAHLLIAKLRFERLVQGSPEASEWFERDPAAFTEAFRRYHREVAPTGVFPVEEAALWRAWKR